MLHHKRKTGRIFRLCGLCPGEKSLDKHREAVYNNQALNAGLLELADRQA